MSKPIIVQYFSAIKLDISGEMNEKAGLVDKPCPSRSLSNGKG
jgi:hypothetical protein